MAKSKPAPKKPAKSAKPAPKASKGAAKSKPASIAKKPSKPAPKTPAKSAPKPSASKAPEKPVKGGKAAPVAKAPEPKPAPAPATQAAADGKKTPPKGITIVSNKPVRKPKPKKLEMPTAEPLIKPGAKWKPLILSGPKAPPSTGTPGVSLPTEFKLDPKAKLAKKELDRYRDILLRKRAELLGDMTNLEEEALRQSSGSLSNMPQHMADQGSDTFDQAMSLSLVDVDRNLIREIDDALKRIDQGTYGVCLHTGKRIPTERLEQVPWTKYTIEAARELERKPVFVRENSYGGERSSDRSSGSNAGM